MASECPLGFRTKNIWFANRPTDGESGLSGDGDGRGGGEGGGIFNPNIYTADFGNFKQGFLSLKLIKRRVISGFRVFFFQQLY